MTTFSPDEGAYAFLCIWGHRGGGYTTEDEAREAELGHECYGGAA